MNSKLAHMAFAIFAGIFVGSLVALKINQNFWWVGTVLGGVVGYLTLLLCTPIENWRKLRVAVRSSKIELSQTRAFFKFKVRKGFWLNVGALTSLFLSFWSWVVICFCLYAPINKLPSTIFLSFSISFFLSLGTFYLTHQTISLLEIYGIYLEGKTKNDYQAIFSVAIRIFPLSLLVGLIIFVPLAIFSLARIFLPEIWNFSKKVIELSFLFIHTQGHTAVFAYAMIGSGLGWYIQAPFTCACIGAVLGIGIYQLVWVHFLKPAEIH